MKTKIFLAIIGCIIISTFCLGEVRITYPNRGGSYYFGAKTTITWELRNSTNDVKLALFKDNVRVGRISLNIPAGANSYSWDIGYYNGNDSVRPGTGYQIQVKEVGSPQMDKSDIPFEIVPGRIEVQAPRGGTLITGESYPVKWKVIDKLPDTKFSLILMQGNTQHAIINSSVEGSEYRWTVHPSYVTGSNYSVKILSRSEKGKGLGNTFVIQSVKPDLEVRKKGMGVVFGRPGNSFYVSFEAIIDNNGYGEAGESMAKLEITGPNNYYASMTMPVAKIVAGDYKKVVFNYNLPSHDRFLNTLTVDYRNNVPEGNESNNTAKTTHYTMPELPDLVVCSLEPKVIHIGHRTNHDFIIKNVGDAPAINPTIRLQVENRAICKTTLRETIPSGGEKTFRWYTKWHTTGGRNYEITVDYTNDIHEYNNNNNTLHGTIKKVNSYDISSPGSMTKCSGKRY